MGGARWLRLIQLSVQLPVLLMAWHWGDRVRGVATALALALAALLLFNPVAWTYQWLGVLFLLVMGLCFDNRLRPAWPASGTGPRP